VIAGKRSDRRKVQGIELARVDGVAMVADHREARARLLELAAARAKAQTVGIVEDPE